MYIQIWPVKWPKRLIIDRDDWRLVVAGAERLQETLSVQFLSIVLDIMPLKLLRHIRFVDPAYHVLAFLHVHGTYMYMYVLPVKRMFNVKCILLPQVISVCT